MVKKFVKLFIAVQFVLFAYFSNAAQIKIIDPSLDSKLFDAVYNDDLEKIKLLVEQGANIRVKDPFDNTILEAAVNRNQERIVEYLLQFGLDVNQTGEIDRTPIFHARDAHMIQYLLVQKANINACDRFGKTALHHASNSGGEEAVTSLLKFGANPNLVDNADRTALASAINVHVGNWRIRPELPRIYNNIVTTLLFAGAKLQVCKTNLEFVIKLYKDAQLEKLKGMLGQSFESFYKNFALEQLNNLVYFPGGINRIIVNYLSEDDIFMEQS